MVLSKPGQNTLNVQYIVNEGWISVNNPSYRVNQREVKIYQAHKGQNKNIGG